jgi:hypothetical protein
MNLTRKIRLWLEHYLRALRYARADKPRQSIPSWICESESFSILEANPMSPIAAGKVGWVERAGIASRLLSTYAIELQQAVDSLEASRSRLATAQQFVNAPGTVPQRRQEQFALTDSSEFGIIERQRRALSMEREALCLLTVALRHRFGSWMGVEEAWDINPPHALLAGMTLLAYFVSIRRGDVVEMLLEAGANPDAPCSYESTALSIASRKADAFAAACPAASQAAIILSLLESASLGSQTPCASPSATRRI